MLLFIIKDLKPDKPRSTAFESVQMTCSWEKRGRKCVPDLRLSVAVMYEVKEMDRERMK